MARKESSARNLGDPLGPRWSNEAGKKKLTAKPFLGKRVVGIHNDHETEEGVGEARSSDEGSNDSGAKGPYCNCVSKQRSEPIGNYYGTERNLWHCFIEGETRPEGQTGTEISV